MVPDMCPGQKLLQRQFFGVYVLLATVFISVVPNLEQAWVFRMGTAEYEILYIPQTDLSVGVLTVLVKGP